jgi:hypothetical protein
LSFASLFEEEIQTNETEPHSQQKSEPDQVIEQLQLSNQTLPEVTQINLPFNYLPAL